MKAIVEWYKTEDKLPDHNSAVYVYWKNLLGECHYDKAIYHRVNVPGFILDNGATPPTEDIVAWCTLPVYDENVAKFASATELLKPLEIPMFLKGLA